MAKEKLVHHHFLYYCVAGRDMNTSETTRQLLGEYLSSLVVFLQMRKNKKILLTYNSRSAVWTGKIVASGAHAVVHYYTADNTAQVDVYSSSSYCKDRLKQLCDLFRKPQKEDFFSLCKHSPQII